MGMEMVAVDKTDYILLKSLEHPKFLDMKRSPVWAIERCWKLADEGFLVIEEDGWVELTEKGKEVFLASEKALKYPIEDLASLTIREQNKLLDAIKFHYPEEVDIMDDLVAAVHKIKKLLQ